MSKHDKEKPEDRPMGALLVTGFLALVILITWFSMYALNITRS